MTIETDLEIIAQQLAEYAKGADVNFKDRLDSFRALTSYHFHKGNPKKSGKESDDDDTATFDQLRQRIDQASASGDGADGAPD